MLAVYSELYTGSIQSKQDSTGLLDRQYDPSIRRTPLAPTRSLVTVLTELSKLLNNTSAYTFKDGRSQTRSSFLHTTVVTALSVGPHCVLDLALKEDCYSAESEKPGARGDCDEVLPKSGAGRLAGTSLRM